MTMGTDTWVLWIEDEPGKTTDLAEALQKNFRLCKAGWSPGPAHSLSAALRYLVESNVKGDLPFPDVVLVDSLLNIDEKRPDNETAIKAFENTSDPLIGDALKCL